MLQVKSTHRLDQIELGLCRAAERHGGMVLATSRLGELLGEPHLPERAVSFTLCFPDLYVPLLAADIRFAAFLPSRVAACAEGGRVQLEAASPREFCRLMHRSDLEAAVEPLEERLRAVMEEAAGRIPEEVAEEHRATEDQVNMRAALPQRIDCHGSKIEELAGTGALDAQGG